MNREICAPLRPGMSEDPLVLFPCNLIQYFQIFYTQESNKTWSDIVSNEYHISWKDLRKTSKPLNTLALDL